MKDQLKGLGTYVVILVVILVAMLLSDSLYNMSHDTYNYDAFLSDLRAGRVSSVEIYQNQTVPTGEVEVMRDVAHGARDGYGRLS